MNDLNAQKNASANAPVNMSFRKELTETLASAWKLDQPDNSAAAALLKNVADSIANIALHSEQYSTLENTVQGYIQGTAKLQALLRNVLKQIEEAQREEELRAHYTEPWWQARVQLLAARFRENPEQGFNEWLVLYAQTLLDGRFEFCARLVDQDLDFPDQVQEEIALMRKGTRALQERRFMDALKMLEFLARSPEEPDKSTALNDTTRALVLIFIGRIYIYHAYDRTAALWCFHKALQLAPSDGRPHAALGDHYRGLATTDPTMRDSATQEYRNAIELSPEQPEGYVGLGLLLEAQQLSEAAEDEYEKAINLLRKRISAGYLVEAIGKLLAPVSGNMFLLLARMLNQEEPDAALKAVTRAIELGIQAGATEIYPERAAYELQGKLLQSLERDQEASIAYFEAARRFYSLGEYPKSIELFRLAISLAPDNAEKNWYLADALVLDSYIPDYPFADEGKVRESLDKWNAGTRVAWPGADTAWAYQTRAVINDSLAKLPDANVWSLSWEAVAYLERLLLLSEGRPDQWSYLGRQYRDLNAQANALHANDKAYSLDPKNTTMLEDRASILFNLQRYDEALKTIEERRNLDTNPNSWIDFLEALVLMQKREYKAACELAKRAVESVPKEVLYRFVLAACYRHLGALSLAKEEYGHILKQYREDDNLRQSMFGWAACMLGDLQLAIDIYTKLLTDPSVGAVSNAYWSLGYCHLLRGDEALADFSNAREELARGIGMAPDTIQLRDFQDDIELLVRDSATLPHREQISVILGEASERIKLRHEQLKEVPSAEEEIEALLSKMAAPDGPTGAWIARISCQAARARLYREGKRWKEAAALYRLLESAGDDFHEASHGLMRCVDGLCDDGDAHLAADNSRLAEAQYEQAIAICLDSSLPNKELRLADLFARLSFTKLLQSQLEDFRARLSEALKHYRTALETADTGNYDWSDPSSESWRLLIGASMGGSAGVGILLGGTLKERLRDISDYWTLDAGLEALTVADVIDDQLRSDTEAIRGSLIGWLSEHFQMAPTTTTSDLFPIVVPIAVEIGNALIPADTGPDWVLFKTYVPNMRERVKAGLGVPLPGVRVRGIAAKFGHDAYRIRLNEVPVAQGKVQLGMGFCPVSPEKVHQLGIPERDLVVADDPRTGGPGCWLPQTYWELVRANHLELWEDPLEYIIYHLEDMLLQNLESFIGLQEVDELLHEWSDAGHEAAFIGSRLENSQARYHFARVLRSLVDEGVPILRWREILRAVESSAWAKMSVPELVRTLRILLKNDLPGNSPDSKRIELPGRWNEALLSGIWSEDGKHVSSSSRELVHELWVDLESLVHSRSTTLVVPNSEMRPLVRSLVREKFPYLWVLSEEELASESKVSEDVQTPGS